MFTPEHPFFLQITCSVPLFEPGLAEYPVRTFIVKILTIEGDAVDVPAGEVFGWVVPRFIGRHSVDLLDVADVTEAGCGELVEAVVLPGTNALRQDLDLNGLGNGVFGIFQIELAAPYRGYDLARLAVWYLLETFAQGSAVAVLGPAALAPEDDGESEQAIEEDLVQYWGQLGFRPVPGNTGYLYVAPGWHSRTAPKLRCPKTSEPEGA